MSVAMYGCEAWTLRKADESRLEAAEIWFFRRFPTSAGKIEEQMTVFLKN